MFHLQVKQLKNFPSLLALSHLILHGVVTLSLSHKMSNTVVTLQPV